MELASGRTTAQRIAALAAIERDAAPALLELAQSELTSRDLDVELEAFEALLRIDTPRSRRIARNWIRRRGATIAHHCDRWLRASSAESLAEALAGAPVAKRETALRRLPRPTWRVAARLVGTDDSLLDTAIACGVAVPVRVMLDAIMRGSYGRITERLIQQIDTAARRHEVLAAVRAALDRDPGPQIAAELIERSRAVAAALEVVDAASVLDELAGLHPVEQLVGVENALGRWVRTGAGELLLALPALSEHVQAQLAIARAAGELAKPRRLPGMPARIVVGRFPGLDVLHAAIERALA